MGIAPNRAVASNTHKRFRSNEVWDYQDISAYVKKSEELDKNKLIVCLNSLHYLQEAHHYPVVVIDEIETVLDKFIGDFLDKDEHKRAIWQTFKVRQG